MTQLDCRFWIIVDSRVCVRGLKITTDHELTSLKLHLLQSGRAVAFSSTGVEAAQSSQIQPMTGM